MRHIHYFFPKEEVHLTGITRFGEIGRKVVRKGLGSCGRTTTCRGPIATETHIIFQCT